MFLVYVFTELYNFKVILECTPYKIKSTAERYAALSQM